MVAAVVVHLESSPHDVLVDFRELASFTPSVPSIVQRGVWHLRHRVRRVHVLGGSFTARLLAAGACAILGIACTFESPHGGASTASP